MVWSGGDTRIERDTRQIAQEQMDALNSGPFRTPGFPSDLSGYDMEWTETAEGGGRATLVFRKRVECSEVSQGVCFDLVFFKDITEPPYSDNMIIRRALLVRPDGSEDESMLPSIASFSFTQSIIGELTAYGTERIRGASVGDTRGHSFRKSWEVSADGFFSGPLTPSDDVDHFGGSIGVNRDVWTLETVLQLRVGVRGGYAHLETEDYDRNHLQVESIEGVPIELTLEPRFHLGFLGRGARNLFFSLPVSGGYLIPTAGGAGTQKVNIMGFVLGYQVTNRLSASIGTNVTFFDFDQRRLAEATAGLSWRL